MIWGLYILLNELIAWWNNKLRLKAIKENRPVAIRHGWWGLLYSGLCMIPFIFYHNWIMVASIALLHLSYFPVRFNQYSGLSPFNLSTTSRAITDRIQVKLGLKSSELVNVASFVASVFLTILYYLYEH